MKYAIRISMFVGAGAALVACGETAEQCFPTRSNGHAAAFGAELAAAEISYQINAENRVCVDAAAAMEAERIGARVEQYYVGAATLIQSPKHRQRLVSVLDERGKEFSIQPTTDGRELLVVYSGTESEFAENQALLESVE